MTRAIRLLVTSLLLTAPLLLAVETQAPSAAPQVRPQDDPPVWAGSFSEAVERARKMRDGRVFVELTEPDCEACARMQQLIYPSASFRALMRDKVPVVIDRSSPDGQKLAGRFRIKSVPAWIILTPDLLFCGMQEGTTNQSTWIGKFGEAETAWARFRQMLDDEKKNPGDAALAVAIGEEAFRRGGDEMAAARFRRVADDPKAPADLRDRSVSFLAAIALDGRRFDEAEKALKRLLATTKNPALAELGELRLADVEIGRGNRAKAATLLRTFLEKHPDSPRRKQAEDMLKALDAAKS